MEMERAALRKWIDKERGDLEKKLKGWKEIPAGQTLPGQEP